MTLGVAEAAHRIGRSCRVVLALDCDRDAVSVYRANFPEAKVRCGDVSTWFDGELGELLTKRERQTRRAVGKGIDFLLGGPPCQGNSNLNNKTRHQDPRNALYARMARAARVLEPECVIIENVPAVLNDRGGIVEVTCESLRRDGYRVAKAVLDLRSVGVPQMRRRLVLLALRGRRGEPNPPDVLAELRDTEPPSNRTVRGAIQDLVGVDADTGFDRASVPSPTNAERINWLFDKELYELPNEKRPKCHKNNSHTYLSVYGRMRWDEPAQTITTGFGSMGQGRYVHPSLRRTITPHEAARIQCFPDFFSFAATTKRGAWSRVIGNAVPPLLTMSLTEAVMESESKIGSPCANGVVGARTAARNGGGSAHGLGSTRGEGKEKR